MTSWPQEREPKHLSWFWKFHTENEVGKKKPENCAAVRPWTMKNKIKTRSGFVAPAPAATKPLDSEKQSVSICCTDSKSGAPRHWACLRRTTGESLQTISQKAVACQLHTGSPKLTPWQLEGSRDVISTEDKDLFLKMNYIYSCHIARHSVGGDIYKHMCVVRHLQT